MTVKKGTLLVLSICLSVFPGVSVGFGQEKALDPSIFRQLDWRNIGPANMGGRTVDLAVVEKTPWIIYAAIGPSGVWKSVNNDTTWTPVFEREKTVSVGDIAVCQSQPEIV